MSKAFSEGIPSMQDISLLQKETLFIEDLFVRWEKIWDAFIPFELNLVLDKFAGCTNGRLIGYYKKSSSFSKKISLYDHTFNLVESLSFPYDTTNLFYYITNEDHVIVLNIKKTGTTCDDYFHSRLISSVSINCSGEVVDAYFWETGLIFITTTNDIWFLSRFKDPYLYLSIPIENSLSKIRCIPPEYSKNGMPIIYATGYDQQLLYIGDSSLMSTVQTPGIVLFLELSPTYEYISILCDNNVLVFAESNLSEIYGSYTIEQFNAPFTFSWLGDMIIIGHEGDVSLYTSRGTCEQKMFDGVPLVFSNSHHALVFAEDKLYRLSIVSQEFVDATRDLPAKAPYLLIKALQAESGHEIELIREKGQLFEAINGCIKASLDLFSNEDMQRMFILAAAFGKSFNGGDAEDGLFNKVKILRLMNSIHSELNIAMCSQEIEEFMYGPTIALRYCSVKKHAIALEISSFTGSDPTPIVTDWCCEVMKEFDDDMAFKIISSREGPGFDPTSIAIAASHMNRNALAQKISEMETYPIKLIHFFLSTDNMEGALSNAIRSMDSNCFISVFQKVLEAKGEEFISSFLLKNIDAYYTLFKLFRINPELSIGSFIKNMPPTESNVDMILQMICDELKNVTTLEPINITKCQLEDKIKKKDAPQKDLMESFLKMVKRLAQIMEGIEKSYDIMHKLKEKQISLNKAIEECVLNVSLDQAFKLAKDSEMKKEKAEVIIVRAVVQNSRRDLFSRIANKCENTRRLATSLILIKLDETEARKFVEYIPDESEKQKIIDLLDNELLKASGMRDKDISPTILLNTPLIDVSFGY